MPRYAVQYTVAGRPGTVESLEFEAADPVGVFSKLERAPGAVNAVLWENGKRLGMLRRSMGGIWEIV